MGAPCAVRQLIHANVKTHGKTRFDIRYSCPGGRKSGDPYTSLGNSIINGVMHLVAYMRIKNYTFDKAFRSMRMLVQGDDNVLFHTGPKVEWKGTLAKLGFGAEAKYRDNLFDVGFCSGRFLPVKDGVILSPRPGRVLMKLGVFVTAGTNKVEDLLGPACVGALYNLHHVPGVPALLGRHIKKGVRRIKPKEWEVWLEKKHECVPETKFWLDRHYHLWPEDCDIDKEINAHWERIFEVDTDGPMVWPSYRL